MALDAHSTVDTAHNAVKDGLANLFNTNAARRHAAMARFNTESDKPGSHFKREGLSEQEELRHRGESEIAIVTPEHRLTEASEKELGAKKQAELAATNGLSPDQSPEKSSGSERAGYKHAIEVEPAAAAPIAPEQPEQAKHPFASLVADAKLDTSWQKDASVEKAVQGRDQSDQPHAQANLAYNAEQVRQQQAGAQI